MSDPPPSGLRDAAAAARALGATTLVFETIMLLLAIQPMRMVAGDLSGAAIAAILAAAVACVVLAGLLRHKWAWHTVLAVQALLVVAGFLHWALAGVGLLFGLVWLYMLNVRRTLLAPPERDEPPAD